MRRTWVIAILLTHIILTNTDRPVYLPHRTILRQLQGEVHECPNTSLCQGNIHPFYSPYTSQVVIVPKNVGEIHLCVDYRKLHSIIIRDAFPLSCIDDALHVVHSSNVFTSFNLVQGDLQLAMAEDIKKTSFKADTSGCTSLLICLLAWQMLVKLLQVDGAMSG